MNPTSLGLLLSCGVASGFGGSPLFDPETQCAALAAEQVGYGSPISQPIVGTPTCLTDRKYPTADGSCACNADSDTQGMIGSDYSRILPASFDHDKLPSARAVSNAFWSRDPKYTEYGISQNMLVLATIQYGVHDFTDSRNHADQPPTRIPVPADDPVLTSDDYLEVSKSIMNKTDYTIPNFGSHWLDQGSLYGNSLERQMKLRVPGSAKLKTDPSGQFLPSEEETGVKMSGPECTKKTQTFFAAGGRLANMNHLMLLTTTLFLRNHNAWVDNLLEWAPELAGWSTDELFGLVRHINTMQLEVLVGEYVGSYFGGSKNPFKDKTIEALIKGLKHCNANIECTVPIEFAMVYRWHDFMVPMIGDVDFVGTAYNPDPFRAPGYLDQLVRDSLTTRMTRTGSGVIDSLRTMEHGNGIWDLAALGIARSRERGVPGYLAYRECFGFDPIATFEEMSTIPEVVEKLKALYDKPSDVDLLVGIEVEGMEPDLFPHPPFIALMLTLAPLKMLTRRTSYGLQNVLAKEDPNLLIHATSGIATEDGDLYTRIIDIILGTSLKGVLVGTTNVDPDEIPDDALLIPSPISKPTKINAQIPPWLRNDPEFAEFFAEGRSWPS